MKLQILLVILLLNCVFAKHLWENGKIQSAFRTVDLQKKYAESKIQIQFTNDGKKNNIKNFYYIVPPEYANNVVLILMEDQDKKEYPGKIINEISNQENSILINAKIFEFELPKELQPGQSVKFTIKEQYYKRLDPLPKKILLNEDQLLVFKDNQYIFSPYPIDSQTTVYKVSGIISNTAENQDKVNKMKSQIKYGEFENMPPFKKYDIQIHYQNNNDLPYFSIIEKKVDVSHWGNIAIDTFHVLHNDAANLLGEFGRINYNKYNDKVGRNAIKELSADLPYHAWGVSYYDEIGNISTSHAIRFREEKVVKLQITPRFPVLGGWKTNWHLGYNLNVSRYLYQDEIDDTKYTLELSFGQCFSDIIAEEYIEKIVLPEGAYDISLNLPFQVDEKYQEVTYSKLDTTGRPVIVLKKKFVNDYHEQQFYVNYRLNKMSLYKKPILLLALYITFFTFMILIKRINLTTFNNIEKSK